MAITDLTGTTWVFDVSKKLNHAALNGQTFEFSVNYITNGKKYDGTAVSYRGTTIKIEIDSNGNGQVYIAWENGRNQHIHNGYEWQWYYQKGLSITFEGGTDANNATLIAWLEDNAVRQINGILFNLSTLALSAGTHTITVKAKGTGYIASPASNAVRYGNPVVSGTWVLNDVLAGITPEVFDGLMTTSLSDIKISITAYTPSYEYSMEIVGLFYSNSGGYDGFCYQSEGKYGTNTGYWYYGYTGDCWYTKYPVWVFGEEQKVSEAFYDWLTANATKQ